MEHLARLRRAVGAGGSTGYLASSASLNNQCDQVRSPTIQLTATSTMSVENNYGIEGFDTQWWDRANIGIVSGGTRSAVDPDGGRLYNASGAGATCATAGQDGWADVKRHLGLKQLDCGSPGFSRLGRISGSTGCGLWNGWSCRRHGL